MDEEKKAPEQALEAPGEPEPTPTPKKGTRTPKRSEASGKEKKESLYVEVRGEFKKVIWPGRTELIKQTITVIIVSLLFGGIIFVMDAAFGFGINSLIDTIILGT